MKEKKFKTIILWVKETSFGQEKASSVQADLKMEKNLLIDF